MVLKDDARKVLDLMGTKHRETDPDDEFLDRLQKKTSFYEQPAALPEALNLPGTSAADAAAALDGLADVTVVDEEDADDEPAPPAVVVVEDVPVSAEEAAAAKAAKAAREQKEGRFAALFYGRSTHSTDQQGGVPEGLAFERISVQPQQAALPAVGVALTPAEAADAAEQAAEDEARREAWRELNHLRDKRGEADATYRAAHERFVATWGHHGAELRE